MFEQKDNSETQISIFNREKKKEKGVKQGFYGNETT
jgi:hypothetical protein